MITKTRRTLRLLSEHRGRAIHIIDPFKVAVGEACEKARLIAELGYPFLILGSTDYEDFEGHMPSYVDAVKSSSGLPVVLHFPPRPGSGLPLTNNADAVFCPVLLGSESPYMVWHGLLETMALLAERGVPASQIPELIVSASLTFGDDEKSRLAMDLAPVGSDPQRWQFYVEMTRRLGCDQTYLYSRHEGVTLEACAWFRRHLPPEHLLFIGGGVSSRKQICRRRFKTDPPCRLKTDPGKRRPRDVAVCG